MLVSSTNRIRTGIKTDLFLTNLDKSFNKTRKSKDQKTKPFRTTCSILAQLDVMLSFSYAYSNVL
jgi:hypothetical protein